MAEDLKVIKKKITEEWLNAFPQLTEYAQNKLYKVVGLTIIGIELIKLPRTESYRPHFVVYPIWKSNLKACLDSPIILYELYNKKGLQFSIPYDKHNLYFSEVLESAKKQILLPFDKDVPLKTMLDLIDNRFNDMLIKAHSGKQAALYEFKLYAALYLDSNEVQNVLEQIQKESKKWNMQLFEAWHGTFDKWFQSLQEKVAHRNEFIAQIQLNKQDTKLKKLNQSEMKL
jgi:hypothetical protein